MDPPALLTVNKQSNLTCRCSSPANSSEGGESETTTTREDGGKFSLNYFKADFSDLKCGGNKPWCMKLVKASANTSIYPWDPLVHFHQAFASSFMSAYQPFALESVSRSGIVWKKSWVIWYVLRQSDLMKNALSVRAGFFFSFWQLRPGSGMRNNTEHLISPFTPEEEQLWVFTMTPLSQRHLTCRRLLSEDIWLIHDEFCSFHRKNTTVGPTRICI